MQVKSRTKKVLILGGSGRVATMLRRYWTEYPSDYMDLSWQARRSCKGIDHIWAPGDTVSNLPQCDVIVASWGIVSGDEDHLNGNILLAQAAHDIARTCGADRVLHASTAAVYAPSDAPINEDSPPAPRNLYGKSKYATECALSEAVPRAVVLRIGNAVGADSLFATLDRGAAVTLDRFPDGRGPMRSYVQPSTLAKVIEALALCPLRELPDVLNVAGSFPVQMADIARAAGTEITWRDAPAGAFQAMFLDTTRLSGLVDLQGESTDPATMVAQWRAYGGFS